MTTTFDTVLEALRAAVAGAAGTATVQRNGALPQALPAAGLVVIADGDPGEPERVLGGSPSHHWQHRAEIEIYATAAAEATRRATALALAEAIGAAIETDRTLGGAVDWAEPSGWSVREEADTGGHPILVVNAPVVLVYGSDGPLA